MRNCVGVWTTNFGVRDCQQLDEERAAWLRGFGCQQCGYHPRWPGNLGKQISSEKHVLRTKYLRLVLFHHSKRCISGVKRGNTIWQLYAVQVGAPALGRAPKGSGRAGSSHHSPFSSSWQQPKRSSAQACTDYTHHQSIHAEVSPVKTGT